MTRYHCPVLKELGLLIRSLGKMEIVLFLVFDFKSNTMLATITLAFYEPTILGFSAAYGSYKTRKLPVLIQ